MLEALAGTALGGFFRVNAAVAAQNGGDSAGRRQALGELFSQDVAYLAATPRRVLVADRKDCPLESPGRTAGTLERAARPVGQT